MNEVCKKDNRFRLFKNPEHKGAGAARNKGIDNAYGKYAIFVDGDDSFHEDLLRDTVLKLDITGADICAFDFERIYLDGRREHGYGVYDERIREQGGCFNYKDIPDNQHYLFCHSRIAAVFPLQNQIKNLRF